MNDVLIRKIAVLCKDYYVNRTIDDLFVLAGASLDWYEVDTQYGGSRMDNVYGWIDAIKKHAPSQLEVIILEVAQQLLETEHIPEADKKFIERRLGKPRRQDAKFNNEAEAPTEIEILLEIIIKGIPRAILPLKHRRKNAIFIQFDNEYDIQSLLHSLLAPWVKDIRVEEYTPSYAGSSARIDFLLPAHSIVLETKFVRDSNHAKNLGDELVIDIDRYRVHQNCKVLWIIVYDSQRLLSNPDGLVFDLEGQSQNSRGSVQVRVFIIH